VVVHPRTGDPPPLQVNTARADRARIPQAKRGGSTGLPNRSSHVTCGNDEGSEPGPDRGQGRTAAAAARRFIIREAQWQPPTAARQSPAPQPQPGKPAQMTLATELNPHKTELNPHKAVPAASRARASKAAPSRGSPGTRWAVGECFQAARNETGLDHYRSAATTPGTGTPHCPCSRLPSFRSAQLKGGTSGCGQLSRTRLRHDHHGRDDVGDLTMAAPPPSPGPAVPLPAQAHEPAAAGEVLAGCASSGVSARLAEAVSPGSGTDRPTSAGLCPIASR
jgi:hypothetical protein